MGWFDQKFGILFCLLWIQRQLFLLSGRFLRTFPSLLSLSFSPSLFCIVASLCDVVPSEASLSEWAGRAIDLMFEGGMREREKDNNNNNNNKEQ